MIKNLIFHERNKLISIKFHYIRELMKNQEIELKFYKLEDQIIYIFNKPLKINALEKLKMMFVVIDFITWIKGVC